MDYKILLGIIAIVVGCIGYIPYFRSMIAGTTKPHAFSWLIWSIIAAITFAAQITNRAGPGAWVSAAYVISCLIVFIFALKKGEKNIALLDWLSLLGAGISLFFWYLTNSPLLTVIIITLIDCFGYIPTIRKSYHAPYEENADLYFWSGMSYVIALFAMKAYSVITLLNPFVLILTNVFFVLLLLWRRKVILRK